MPEIPDYGILIRRMKSAINRIGLDLRGQNVLTEAGSGHYMLTPIIAALAGANHVTAKTRNSRWGAAHDIKLNTLRLANELQVDSKIEITEADAIHYADHAHIVTNLGFVRPITRQFIEKLPVDAAIALMWEPWEYRSQDLDLRACIDCGIPVIATNENHANVSTFRFVGLLALKLLFEAQVEVCGLNILVIGSNPFGSVCLEALSSAGANVFLHDPTQKWPPNEDDFLEPLIDALILVEHRYSGELLGKNSGPILAALIKARIPVIHICGNVDEDFLSENNCYKYPHESAPFGYMTVTTAYLGAKPVVDLHCAGLHAASLVSRARGSGATIHEAIDIACKSGYGLALDRFIE